MRKLRLKKVKGLTMVLKNLISGIWRASVNPESFGASGQQSPRARSEALLAQPWSNSLLKNGYPGSEFFASSISRKMDILIGPYYFPFSPCFTGSQVYDLVSVVAIWNVPPS